MYILNEQTLTSHIDQIAGYDLENKKIWGSAYHIFQKDQLCVEKCFGTLAGPGSSPILPSTLFRLASMTKPVTAVAALILYDRGLLCLEDPVSKFLPEYTDIRILTSDGHDLGTPGTAPTIRHILTHSSGIGSEANKLSSMKASHKATLDASVSFFLKNGLDFEPGSQQMYSGMGAFDVLTKIIETVSGMDYFRFLKQEIFDPCQMEDTVFVPDKEQLSRMASMHTQENGQNAAFPMPDNCVFEDFPCTHYVGGAGLASTLQNYSRFCQMLLAHGVCKNQRLLSERAFLQFSTPQISKTIMPGAEQWGLGVRVITDSQYPWLPVGTFGWSGAYGSHFWVDPQNEIYAVFLKNSKVDGGAGNQSARLLERAVYAPSVDL